jgi:hypothetical protein
MNHRAAAEGSGKVHHAIGVIALHATKHSHCSMPVNCCVIKVSVARLYGDPVQIRTVRHGRILHVDGGQSAGR